MAKLRERATGGLSCFGDLWRKPLPYGRGSITVASISLTGPRAASAVSAVRRLSGTGVASYAFDQLTGEPTKQ
jgi:hypothetical protein